MRAREVIERQVQHLVCLIDDLLDVSRITRGMITLQRERVLIDAVVARAVETARPLIDSRRHELTLDLPEELLSVDGDSTRLVQIIGTSCTTPRNSWSPAAASCWRSLVKTRTR